MKKIFSSPLPALWLTVFIDLLGLGIVIPIFAALFFIPNGPFFLKSIDVFGITLNTNVIYGLLIATYPFAQFIAAPILGDLSDRYGRRIVLLSSISGTLFGYIVIAIGILTQNLLLIFLGRLIDGVTGGNISVAQSAIADISTPETKAKNFGLIGMAFGLGLVIGPYVGGKLSDPTIISWFSDATPFLFATLLTFLNILLITFNLPETHTPDPTRKINLTGSVMNIAKAVRLARLRNILLVTFLFIFGFNFFTQFFQVYLIEFFKFTPSQIGDLFAYIGVWIAITQGIFLRKLLVKFTPAQIVRISLFILAGLFIALTFPTTVLGLYIVLTFIPIFNGLSQPNITAITSNLADEKTQGEIIGINQSVASLAQTIPPLIAGFISSISPTLPLIVAGGFTLLAGLAFLAFERSEKAFWKASE